MNFQGGLVDMRKVIQREHNSRESGAILHLGSISGWK